MSSSDLSDDQRRAVERRGQDVCVVAGPGSGKTRVLTERFAWLVEAQGVDPGRILAVTFTEKAATEIKERLIARFAALPELRERIEHAWVSTIHGFCARLLREHAIAAGMAPDFSVLDAAAADRLAREAAEEAIEQVFGERPEETRELLDSLDLSTQDDGPQPDLARSLLAVYETMRISGHREFAASAGGASAAEEAWGLARVILNDVTVGRTENQQAGHATLREWARKFLDHASERRLELARLPVHLSHLVKSSAACEAARRLKNEVLERVAAEWIGEKNAPLLELMKEMIARLEARYREKKREIAGADFADLEEETIRLLESDETIRRATVGRFDEILMDELQDTNRLQWRLVNLIRRRMFAVGDVNQSIFGFRHAEPAVFHEYRSTLAAAVGEIDELYENHRSYSEILTAVSRMLDGAPGIEPRALAAERGPGPAVERYVGLGERGEEVEAALVATRIADLRASESREFRDFAVLVRALRAVDPFERAFDRFGIPFLVSGGRTFLEAREIRDVMALLAALVNPLDEIALIGVLRSPLVGMSDEEIFRIGREKWRDKFAELFGRLRKMADFFPPDLLLARALDECGYTAGISERGRANLEKFLGWVRRESRPQPRTLAELLEDAEALRAQQAEAEAPPPDAANVVRVMTIHAAKGLEFPVVFVSALHRRPDSRKPVIAFSAASGLGAKWRNPETGTGQSDAAHMRYVEEAKRKEEEEENRLLYVAMTRAEDRLILSHAERKGASVWVKMAEAVPVTVATARSPEPASSIAMRLDSAAEKLYDRPSITGQYDATVAVTAIAAFQACPRRYFLSTLAERQVTGGDGGIETGLAVHRILAGETIDAAEAQALAARFEASELGLRAARADRVEREFDFMLHVDDVILRGQIDLWFEESGELVLVDYKTDRDQSRTGQYALQLRLYALALERYAGRLPDRAVLYYLRADRAVEAGLSASELAQARAAVEAFRQAQDRLEFPMRVSEKCGRCEFVGGLCPARTEEFTATTSE